MKFVIPFIIQFCWLISGSLAEDGCTYLCSKGETCRSMEYKSTCYIIYTDKERTWQENRDLCTEKNSSMVNLQKEMIQNGFSIQKLVDGLETNSNVWLGGRANDTKDWIFINDVRLNDTYSNQPEEIADGQEMHLCGVVHYDGTVEKDDCRNMNNFVCRFEDWRGIPTFYISEIPVTWFEAISRCEELGAKLFYLKHQEDMKFMKIKLTSFKDQKLFIGLTHRFWQWEDQPDSEKLIIHYNWQYKEPNKFSEKCILMFPWEGLWNDMDCNATMFALCQKEAHITDTPVTPAPVDSLSGDGNGALIAVIVVLSILLLIAMAVIPMTYCKYKVRQERHFSQETVNHPDETGALLSTTPEQSSTERGECKQTKDLDSRKSNDEMPSRHENQAKVPELAQVPDTFSSKGDHNDEQDQNQDNKRISVKDRRAAFDKSEDQPKDLNTQSRTNDAPVRSWAPVPSQPNDRHSLGTQGTQMWTPAKGGNENPDAKML